MVKKDLADRIQHLTGYTKGEAAGMLEAVISLIKTTLESGETVKISGFGSFIVKDKKARRGRNPQTSESIILDARRVITYKPSARLRDRINAGK